MLADIFDQIALNTDVTAKHGTRERAKVSRPYPRPGAVLAPKTFAELDLSDFL